MSYSDSSFLGYSLLDSGEGCKLEQFGSFLISRPASQALWTIQNSSLWKKAHASFSREPDLIWTGREKLPQEWEITVEGMRFLLKATDFGHLGIFPEQSMQWKWIRSKLSSSDHVLNLFAYSGGSTMAAALAGATVWHVDASKGMVSWARKNAELNNVEAHWIVEDAMKFLQREKRRGKSYEAIILDPPTFGRGNSGEIFKIEEQIVPLLAACFDLLSSKAKFLLLSCHTPGMTPVVLENLLKQFRSGKIESGELLLEGEKEVLALPSGCYARWMNE